MNIKQKKYYNAIWKKIKDSWVLPSDSKDLLTILVIKIDKDGKIKKIKIEKSSKSEYYDQAAIRAVRKAEPYPKIEEYMNQDFFEVGIRFLSSEK